MRNRVFALFIILILSVTVIPLHPVAAKPGDLDTTFGTGGYTTTLMLHTTASTAAIQADGKIIVAGTLSPLNGNTQRFAVARYTTNGNLDNAFGGHGNGTVTTGIGSGYSYNGWQPLSYASAVAIQADGKIVVAGNAYFSTGNTFAVARYNTDGTLDSSFNGNGTATLSIPGTNYQNANGLAIQSDGKIIVVGSANVASGNDFAMLRLTSSGSLDSSFGGAGTALTRIGWYAYSPSYSYAYAYAVAIQADGRIIVAGQAYNGYGQGIALARYGTNGVLDPSFGGNSNGTTVSPSPISGPNSPYYEYDSLNTMTILANGEILVGGILYSGIGNSYTQETMMAKYSAQGTLDTSFGTNGIVYPSLLSNLANGISIQPDGRIVLAGSQKIGNFNTIATTRYWPNGTLDILFGNSGVIAPPLGSIQAEAVATLIQTDGKIVVAGSVSNGGSSGFIVARYLTADTIAPTFPTGSMLAASNIGQTGLTLFWTPATDDAGVASYKIYQGANLIGTVSGNVNNYNVTGLSAGTTYTFKLLAADYANNTSTSGPSLTVATVAAPGLLQTGLPWLILLAVVVGFGLAVVLSKKKMQAPSEPAKMKP